MMTNLSEEWSLKRLASILKHVLLCFLILLTACSGKMAADEPSPVPAKSNDAVARQASGVDWAAMETFWIRSTKLRGIYTGPQHSSKHMLVYFDPDCPTCAKQWEILQPYMHKVRIQWIPIAYMSKTSLRRAAAILAAPDPSVALADNEKNYDTEKKVGGYVIPESLPAWALKAVRANTAQAMQTKDSPGTPTLGFELYNGKRYFRMFGMVDERSMDVAVQELGDTMDPWKHPADGNVTPASSR